VRRSVPDKIGWKIAIFEKRKPEETKLRTNTKSEETQPNKHDEMQFFILRLFKIADHSGRAV
jgi:hypothetical protein